mmetsp:Transcript_65862/g.183512  ORF Transcript_65862/g.183512 Transcript_65862/m.183512 type:complete len:223 (-) Transcript_65862:773-1441(-)
MITTARKRGKFPARDKIKPRPRRLRRPMDSRSAPPAPARAALKICLQKTSCWPPQSMAVLARGTPLTALLQSMAFLIIGPPPAGAPTDPVFIFGKDLVPKAMPFCGLAAESAGKATLAAPPELGMVLGRAPNDLDGRIRPGGVAARSRPGSAWPKALCRRTETSLRRPRSNSMADMLDEAFEDEVFASANAPRLGGRTGGNRPAGDGGFNAARPGGLTPNAA